MTCFVTATVDAFSPADTHQLSTCLY